MPNVKSAKKRMVLSRKWAARNRAARARIRTAMRRVREAEDAETAQPLLADAISLLDRAARKRLLHPNRAARLKRQLQTRVNGL
jgi:small subunit ribosomal protein S20